MGVHINNHCDGLFLHKLWNRRLYASIRNGYVKNSTKSTTTGYVCERQQQPPIQQTPPIEQPEQQTPPPQQPPTQQTQPPQQIPPPQQTTPPQQTQQEPQVIAGSCLKCGAQLQANTKFCQSCGVQI